MTDETPEPLQMVSFRLEQSIMDRLEKIREKEKIPTKTEALRRIIIMYDNLSKLSGR